MNREIDEVKKILFAWIDLRIKLGKRDTPEPREICMQRTMSENYYFSKEHGLTCMHMGAGYIDKENSVMRREYSWFKGVAYNISEMEIFNINKIRIKCSHE